MRWTINTLFILLASGACLMSVSSFRQDGWLYGLCWGFGVLGVGVGWAFIRDLFESDGIAYQEWNDRW